MYIFGMMYIVKWIHKNYINPAAYLDDEAEEEAAATMAAADEPEF
jgi:hypothetical protein